MTITICKHGDFWKVEFNHGNQFFTLDGEIETKKEAEWMKDRLSECFDKAFGRGWESSEDSNYFSCPCCGSDLIYKTQAMHCVICATTTEI